MANTSKEVLKFLEREPAIKRCFANGLINTSALAKFIINHPDFELDNATIDAVITAIRRSMNANDKESIYNIQKIFKKSHISSKNKISAVVLKKDEATFALLSDVFKAMDFYGGETLRLVKSSKTIMLLFDEDNLEKVLDIYSQTKINQIIRNLGVVTLYLDSKASNTPGVFSTILNELSINRINIIEAVTCLTEYMIFVEEKDLLKTYEILSILCR